MAMTEDDRKNLSNFGKLSKQEQDRIWALGNFRRWGYFTPEGASEGADWCWLHDSRSDKLAETKTISCWHPFHSPEHTRVFLNGIELEKNCYHVKNNEPTPRIEFQIDLSEKDHVHIEYHIMYRRTTTFWCGATHRTSPLN